MGKRGFKIPLNSLAWHGYVVRKALYSTAARESKVCCQSTSTKAISPWHPGYETAQFHLVGGTVSRWLVKIGYPLRGGRRTLEASAFLPLGFLDRSYPLALSHCNLSTFELHSILW